jgi:hypothetical protein
MGQEAFAGRRQYDGAFGALEKLCTQQQFRLVHRLAERGLRQVQRRGGAAEAQRAPKGEDDLQLTGGLIYLASLITGGSYQLDKLLPLRYPGLKLGAAAT